MKTLTSRGLTAAMIVWLVAAAVAIGLLFLPPRDTTAAPPAPDDTQHNDGHSGDNSEPQDVPVAAGASAVSIASFAFSQPEPLAAGTEVVVTNLDSAPHTLTADDGSFNTGILQAGESARIVLPTQPGAYSFFCELHPSMTGSFTVTP